MKLRLLSLVAVVALVMGAFAAVASAQSYGEEPEESTNTEANTDSSESADSADTGTETDVQNDAPATGVLVQDAEEDAEEEDTERRRARRGGCNLEAAASAIGIEEDALRSARDEGQTIADVAEANGVAVSTVIDAMVDAKAERLAEKVESGRITQEEADEKLADIEDRITDRVNGVDSDDETDA